MTMEEQAEKKTVAHVCNLLDVQRRIRETKRKRQQRQIMQFR